MTDAQFQDFLDAFGFGPSLLLDASGHLLEVAPHRGELIGSDVAWQYEHLTQAINGRATVSNIVLSADDHTQIIALPPRSRRRTDGAS